MKCSRRLLGLSTQLDGHSPLRYPDLDTLPVRLPVPLEFIVAKRSRPAGARPHMYRRRDSDAPAASPGASVPARGTPVVPRVTAPAQPVAAPISTKITTTDYGHVVGELRRIAILTVLILVLLVMLWAVLR